MFKSFCLTVLMALTLLGGAQAAPPQVLQDQKDRKVEQSRPQPPEAKRKLEELQETVEKHALTRPTERVSPSPTPQPNPRKLPGRPR